MVDADEDQLSRVLVNLVRNAVQALSQAGANDGTPLIEVTATRNRRQVVICVKDNGPGIPERPASGSLHARSRSPTEKEVRASG